MTIRDKKGFTLIELIIVIIIIGVLATSAIPVFSNLIDRAIAAKSRRLLAEVRASFNIAYANNIVNGVNAYPLQVDLINSPGTYFAQGAIPINPITGSNSVIDGGAPAPPGLGMIPPAVCEELEESYLGNPANMGWIYTFESPATYPPGLRVWAALEAGNCSGGANEVPAFFDADHW